MMKQAFSQPTSARRHSARPRSREVVTDDSMNLIRAEYVEMPGLSLTEPQVERLWNLTSDIAETSLHELERVHFLRLTKKGTYVRADLGA